MPYDGAVFKNAPALFCVALVVLTAPLASAIPLQVRARTQIVAHADETPGGVAITGRLLRDDQEPVGGAVVRVRLDGAPAREAKTGADGGFSIAIATGAPARSSKALDPSLTWRAEFDGDANCGPVAVSGVLEGARSPSSIRLELTPRTVTLDSDPAKAVVSVRAGKGAVGSVPVFLRVGDGAELVGATDADGDVAFLLHPGALNQQGRLEVSARWPGDHRFSPAQVTRDLRVLQSTRLTLRVAREGSLESGRYRFSGRLGDHRGGVPGATVALRHEREGQGSDRNEVPGAVALTDARGHFVFAVPTQELGQREPGVVEATVVYLPGDGRHAATTSASTRLPVPGPPGVPARLYVAVAMLAMAILVLLELLRSGAIWRWSPGALWRRLSTGQPASRRSSAPDNSPPLRRPDWITVRMMDARTGRDALGAVATLTRLSDGREEPACPETSAWGPLEAGVYSLRCEAPGYLEERHEVTVPHEGELDPCARRLVEVRGHVLTAFVRALRRSGIRFRWGTETPAEVMARCPDVSGASETALHELHRDTEALWFANRKPDRADVERADLLLSQVEERS